MTFAERAEKSGFKLMDPVPTPHGDILLAERYADPKRHDGDLYIETMWAIRRNGVDIGRTLFHKLIYGKDTRRREALADAQQFIEDCLDSGRYTD